MKIILNNIYFTKFNIVLNTILKKVSEEGNYEKKNITVLFK